MMQTGSAALNVCGRQHDRDRCCFRNSDDRDCRPLAAYGRRRSTFPFDPQAPLAPGVFRPVQWTDRTPCSGAVDQRREALQPRGFLLCALHPMCGGAPVPWGLRLKPRPGASVGSKLPGIPGCETRCFHLLVRIQSSLLTVPPFVDLEAVWADALGAHQVADPSQVDCAPDASETARSEADSVGIDVDTVPHAVDPAEAQRLVHRLGPGDAGPAGVALAEPDVQAAMFSVMALEPGAKGRRRLEEHDLHGYERVSRSTPCPFARSNASSSRSPLSKAPGSVCAAPSASAIPTSTIRFSCSMIFATSAPMTIWRGSPGTPTAASRRSPMY